MTITGTPAVADIAAWLKVDEDRLDPEQCERTIAASLAHLARLYTLPTTDAAWIANPDAHLGVVMFVARLRKRSESPNGMIGFDGVVDRVAGYDPDITRLLAPFEIHRFS